MKAELKTALKGEVRILILEDRPVILEGIMQWISQEPRYRIVHTASSWPEMISYIHRDQNLILISTVRSLRPVFQKVIRIKNIRLICLCDESIPIDHSRIHTSNICGIMNQNADRDEFLRGLENVSNGRFYISNRLYEQNDQRELKSHAKSRMVLSNREREVVSLISHGFSDREIGEILHLSKRTIDGYRNNLLIRFGVRNSAHLIRFAIDNSLILPDEVLRSTILV